LKNTLHRITKHTLGTFPIQYYLLEKKLHFLLLLLVGVNVLVFVAELINQTC
jgi:hypothetical protein